MVIIDQEFTENTEEDELLLKTNESLQKTNESLQKLDSCEIDEFSDMQKKQSYRK